MALSPDGKQLVSDSWDGAVRLYATDPGELVALARICLTRTRDLE